MARIISASIDLTKIDKSKIIEGKNGGKFYNIQIFCNDEKDKYGNDVGLTDSQTKEERESKAKKKYLGNGRTVWSSEKTSKNMPNETVTENNPQENDNLPF